MESLQDLDHNFQPKIYPTDELLPSGSNIFYFLNFYLKCAYYLFLIPFRFGTKLNGLYYIHTNIFQKIVSTMILILIMSHGVLDLRFYFAKGLLKTPDKAFVYSYAVLLVIYVFIWFNTFWIKRNSFEKILEICQMGLLEAPEKPKSSWLMAMVAVVIFTEIKFLCETAHSYYQQGFLGIMQYYGGIGLYNLHLRESDVPLSDEEMNPEKMTFCVLYFLLVCQYRHVEHFIELLAFSGAIMIYYISVQFIRNIKRLTLLELKSIVDTFTNFSAIVNGMNSITETAVLIYVVGMIPTFVWCVFGLFDPNNYEFVIFYVHKVIMHSSQLVIAAKANAKVKDELNEWVMEIKSKQIAQASDPGAVEVRDVSGFIDFMYTEINNNRIGLRGGNFFTITYGFIGAAVSVIVTYAVVMLQFQVEKYKKSEVMDGNDNVTTIIEYHNSNSTEYLQTLQNFSSNNSS